MLRLQPSVFFIPHHSVLGHCSHIVYLVFLPLSSLMWAAVVVRAHSCGKKRNVYKVAASIRTRLSLRLSVTRSCF